MARTASVAVAGYFPTPPDVVQRVIGLFVIPEPPIKGQSRAGWNMVDPCAGEGAALRAVAETFRKSGDARSFLAEMEANRAMQCRQFGATVVHGDYFLVESASEFAGLLWLNPPYDTDRDTKRLEEKFLRRAAPVLAPNGILVFIVPGYALAASAHTLAKGFVDLQCWRFPDESFGDFKQVVLVARRAPKPEADPEIVALVQGWANNFANLEPLPKNPVPTLRVPMATQSFPTWQLSLVDLPTVREQFHPWMSERGELTDLNPPVDLAARFHRVFPVASVPRATHLAAALAAGVFNGARVEPDDPSTGLPPLLVKGVFDKEFRTVEEKRNKDGEKVAEVQVQHPVLQVTVLDLNAGTFHTIRPSVDLPLITGVEGMTLANLLDSYGLSLMRAMRDACPVLHDPKRDPEIEISTLAQPLFAAQKSVVNTLLRMVREQGRKGAVILGEIGSGKTRCALGASAELGAKRILVLCPPHLLDTWRNETNAVLPGYNVMVLDSITDAETFATIDRPTVGVLSREKAKLGHGWRSVEGSCPKCGAKLDPEVDYAGKRARCENLLRTPRNAAAHWLVDHINDIARIAPNHSILRTLLGWTAYGETRLAKQTESGPWVDLDPTFVEGLIPAAKDRHLAAWLVWAVPALAQRVADSRQEDNAYDALCFHKQLLLAVLPNEPVTHKTLQYTDYGPKVSEWETHRQFLYRGPEAGKGHYAWKEYENGKYQGVPRGSRLAFLRLLEVVVSRALFAAVECREPLYQAVAEPRRYPLATWLCHRRRDSYDVLVVDECFPGDTRISTPSGDVPIREIRVGDFVWSATSNGDVVARKVLRVIATPNTQGLVRVRHTGGSLDCTPGHKIWCPGKGSFVQAMALHGSMRHADPDENVCVVRQSVPVCGETEGQGTDRLRPEMRRRLPQGNLDSPEKGNWSGVPHSHVDLRVVSRDRGSACHEAESVLREFLRTSRRLGDEPNPTSKDLCLVEGPSDTSLSGLGFPTNDSSESRSNRAGQGERGFERPLYGSGRERPRADACSSDAPSGHRMADGGGHPNWEPSLEGGGGGFGPPLAQNRGGVRRGQPPDEQAEEPGSAEDGDAYGSRLGGSTLLELRNHREHAEDSGHTPGCRVVRTLSVEPIVRPDVDVVFDLEVEDTHRYFANDILVSNCHEFSSEDSAQSHAKARLEMNPRAYRILLTGSLANGYADSVYNNIFAISESFQTEFGREGRTRFVDRYGYWKQIVTEKDTEGKVIAFGSQSDRVERSARRAGMAPGILPLFNLEWLLPNAVTLQKEDLRLDLPEPEHSTDVVGLLEEQATNYKYLLTTLLQEIKDSRWEEGRAGKLWGALAHLPSYLDLACSGDYTIRWPENVPGVGGQEIVKVPGLDPSIIILPKEEWMLSTVDRETAAGRPVLVLAWHRDVLSRLLGVLHRRGYTDAIYLDAQEVGTKKRQAWIDRHVVKAGRRVMVVNPVTIQTGLNNLVHFKTQVWMENPACNPHIYRQAQGRIDRIGQTVTPRFTFPLYDGTMQQQAHRLLLHKVGVALGVDGLDPEAALRAAGVEDENFQGLSVGRALYRLLTGE